MLGRVLVLVVLLSGLVLALDIEMDCPSEVYVGESFECEIEVDGSGEYDLKVGVEDFPAGVLKVWNGNGWQSSYYYLKEFVDGDCDVKLILEEEGKYDLFLKLRRDSYVEEFDGVRVRAEVLENESLEVSSLRDGRGSGVEMETVFLGGEGEDDWDYVSKDGRVVDALPYIFCLFLIFFVGVLTWDKFGRN